MQILQQLTIIHPELLSTVETTVRIENDPFMALTIEHIGLGPRGLPALSITHYGEQNGDLMRDPEMCFEMEIENGYAKRFHPFYYRDDYIGVEQFSVIHDGTDADNKAVCRICARMLHQQIEFARMWDVNLAAQGFLKAHAANAGALSGGVYGAVLRTPPTTTTMHNNTRRVPK